MNQAAKVADEERMRAAQRAQRQQRQGEAELKRVRVHALNQVLAASDAAEVMRTFGTGAAQAGATWEVRV